jgi:hypothetical protein
VIDSPNSPSGFSWPPAPVLSGVQVIAGRDSVQILVPGVGGVARR